jgi:UDP-N-acetylmuramate dehydrogenase
MDEKWQKVKAHFGDKLQVNFPLKTITTVRTGGDAKGLIRAKTQPELIDAVEFLKTNNIAFLVVGGLSNLLFSDQGFDGIIIKNEVTGIDYDGKIIHVQSGTPLQELVDFTVKNRLAGMQKMTGIPGTVGGAVYGNAGAYGQTISDFITSVTFLRDGQKITLDKIACKFDYRTTVFKQKKDIVLSAEFKLTKTNREELQKESAEILNQRQKKYPPGLKSPGSFFMNVYVDKIPPEGLKLIPKNKVRNGRAHVGWILESVGSKGEKVGDVHVADYHGNLFINAGRGTSADYLNLATNLAKKVKAKYGIILHPEVQMINLPKIEV